MLQNESRMFLSIRVYYQFSSRVWPVPLPWTTEWARINQSNQATVPYIIHPKCSGFTSFKWHHKVTFLYDVKMMGLQVPIHLALEVQFFYQLPLHQRFWDSHGLSHASCCRFHGWLKPRPLVRLWLLLPAPLWSLDLLLFSCYCFLLSHVEFLSANAETKL